MKQIPCVSFFNDKNHKTHCFFPKNPINVELFTQFTLEKKYLKVVIYCYRLAVVLLLMVEYSVLSLLYLLSYFKLFVTLVKYIPQVSQLIKPYHR
jgi:hypothetical protein